ncbi:hypothetical protein P170DRAFT_343735 [Aspergillus steynii IBT 23096]|uniref:TLC domain-containing protein n=1 Tax=Aspergillus steynii IBT 23096 TaxID=1392250 RepID=A0A2I2GM82_9EURO|nr:uncharacterized protein P170DRAFT_343735 [Aspergillus steynii IBT 23096]PLB53984.1 hypothetical protein P170DRAFT_343735 [Aspergillus steynii IBT 23096]
MAPKIIYLENETLSFLLPRGSLILCSCTLAIVLLSNVLERWLLAKLYQIIWKDLSLGRNERRRRSFTYFHIGVTIMLILVLFGAYPVFDFLVGHARVSSTLHRNVTYGDYMFVLSHVYSAYYIFEVCFRTRFASAISIAHHIGLLIVIQTTLTLFGDLRKYPEAILEFYMCMVWGSFDVVVELPLYTFMIIWRVKANDHHLLSRMAYACCVWVLLGATVETAVTIWLLKSSWHRWGTSCRILLPLVFSLWICTQLYGAFRIFGMAQSKARLASTRSGITEDCDREIAEATGYRKSHSSEAHDQVTQFQESTNPERQRFPML